MNRKTDYCKEYKNGNINMKLDCEMIEKAAADDIGVISEILFWLDCYFVGDIISLGNFDAGYNLYNVNRDLLYIISGRDIEKLKAGKSIKLYARRVNKYDKEMLTAAGF